MIASLVISAATFVAITLSVLFFPSVKLGKVKLSAYWIIALAGAVILLAAGLVSLGEVVGGLTSDSEINPLKILILFFSMTFLSVMLDEVGFFRFLAGKAVASANASQYVLFVILYALTAVLTVFTSNDIVILTLTPFICFFCKNTKIDPLPYLVGEFAAANTWSMMLIIGNPTNIYLATSAGIDFISYFKVMALPTLAAGLVEFGLIMLLFRKRLNKPLEPQKDDFAVKSKTDLVIGLIHLAVCLAFLVVSGYIGVQMWLVSAACACSLLVCTLAVRLITRRGWEYLGKSFVRLPWQLIPFFLSMFVIVVCLNAQGVAGEIAKILGDGACVWTYGGSSFVAANLINNIPMSILFSTLPVSLPQAEYLQAVYATIVGSNIGAFLTPIGALAGIMFTGLTEKYEVNYGFKQFVKYGAIISLPTIGAALIVLSIIL